MHTQCIYHKLPYISCIPTGLGVPTAGYVQLAGNLGVVQMADMLLSVEQFKHKMGAGTTANEVFDGNLGSKRSFA